MSPSNSTSSNKNVPVEITNPYTNSKNNKKPNNRNNTIASKSKSNQEKKTESHHEDDVPTQPQHLPITAPVEVGPNATFSQAFRTVEETTHYQKENTTSSSNGTSTFIDQEQAEQRHHDASTGGSIENATSTKPTNLLSARDTHSILSGHVLHISNRQRGNRLIRFIRNVPYEFTNMVPDYIMGPTRCALFLSFKYHRQHPNYIHERVKELRTDFDLRVLLALVDIEHNESTLEFLNIFCCTHNFTLLLAWSYEEAARYLETMKVYEHKDASAIQKRESTTFADQVADVLGCVRSVNRTDAGQLMSQFGTFQELVNADVDELCLCPGIGHKKVKRLYEAFHKKWRE